MQDLVADPPVQMLALSGAMGSMRLALAPARASRPRATIVFLTGRAEFVEKHDETLADLRRLDFAVAIVEWRGQGLSARDAVWPHRGHVDDFAHYLEDLDRALEKLEALGAPRPWLMLAHSMGGHIGLRWLYTAPDSFAAAAMTAPMFGIRLKGVPELIARSLGWAAVRSGRQRYYAPGQKDFIAANCRFERNPLTSSPERFARLVELMGQRPELTLGGVTWGWLDAALRSIALTEKPGVLERIGTPILLCVADQERIVQNRSIERFAQRLPAATLKRFDARHELLLERDPVRQEVLRTIDGFFAGLGY